MIEQNHNGNDRIETHYRLQLSALMDGALPPDEARFLLRRLQHDTELGGCWERWQMAGETLRGRVVAPLPVDFSQRVAAAVAAEPVPARASSTQMPRWARWSGGALAASVALVALFMARQQSPVDAMPDSQPTQIVAASSAAPTTPAPEPLTPPAPSVDPNAASALAATAIAVADVPRRAANRRTASSRSQSQRAALRAPARNSSAELPFAIAANASASGVSASASGASGSPAVIIAAASAPTAVASSDPFASQPIAPSRPWPSATLPQYPSSGAFSVDYGATGSYYPFQPRLPASSPSAGSEPETQDAPLP